MHSKNRFLPIASTWLTKTLIALVLIASTQLPGPVFAQQDPLPSWNEGSNKAKIIDFVDKVTKEGSEDFVPIARRIATFDNDGTLWCEQPVPSQLLFVIDETKKLAPQHPEWKDTEPFKSVLNGDLAGAIAQGSSGFMKLLTATSGGMTTDEFYRTVSQWMPTYKHPRFDRPCTELVYKPMIELLTYLRANGFKTYIVSGGGSEFMRPWTEQVYGIPPEQVIGSTEKTEVQWRGDKPVLMRLPDIDSVNDKEGKTININKYIGRRPIAAFGNSDGDLSMLQWTAAGNGRRLMLLVHHTDAEREWAYDRGSKIGALDKALDEAMTYGWLVVDMKSDWKQVFAFDK